jgi:hypothetical protein
MTQSTSKECLEDKKAEKQTAHHWYLIVVSKQIKPEALEERVLMFLTAQQRVDPKEE